MHELSPAYIADIFYISSFFNRYLNFRKSFPGRLDSRKLSPMSDCSAVFAVRLLLRGNLVGRIASGHQLSCFF